MAVTYTAKFEKELQRQIVALMQRDIRAQLDIVGGVGVLDNFQEYDFAFVPVLNFPAFAAIPTVSAFDPESVGSLKYQTQFAIGLAVQHQDRNAVASLIEDYVNAVHRVIDGWQLADFNSVWPLSVTGIDLTQTVGLPASSQVMRIFVESHEYGELKNLGVSFGVHAALTLVMDLEEA